MLILLPLIPFMVLGRNGKQRRIKTLIFYSFPIAFYLSWLVACRITLGWFLFPSHVGILNFSSLTHLVKVMMERAAQLLLRDGHWVLTLIIAAGAWTERKNFPWTKAGIPLLVGGLAVYGIFYSFYSVPLDRYLLPVYPLFFLLCSWSLDRLSKQRRTPAFIVLVGILALFVMNWRGQRSAPGFALESNMEYLDFIEVHRKATKYLEDHFPDKHILTHWPQTMELRYPFEGYVAKPIRTSGILEAYDLSEIDLVYFVPQSQKEFADVVKDLNLAPLASFEKNGKRAVLYKLRKAE
jgi:hypothetical protein